MKAYANLHLHSTHSDGVFTPEELVKYAKEEGYKAISITDHDTATAYDELKSACLKEEMECVFGVEFSVVEPKEYHIVGFNFDPEYPEMKEYLLNMGKRQTDNTKKCFDLAKEKGDITGISWEEIQEYNKNIAWLCNNHIFNAMLKKGLVKKEEYMKWFEKNFLVQRSYFPPAFEFKTAKEIIELINKAGGIAVLAHPHEQLDDVKELIKMGLKGIEVSHSMLTDDEKKKAFEMAIENNLFISGGTDHEGFLGGHYSSFEDEDELKKSIYYIEPLSIGVSEAYFREIQNGKISR